MSTLVARPRTRRTAAGFAIAAAAADVICVGATILFFSLELTSSAPHVFGPISDVMTSVFDVLFLPVIVYFVRSVTRSPGFRIFGWVAVGATLVGAVNSALLVVGMVPDGVSLGVTLAVIAIQAGWFVWLGIALRREWLLPKWLGTFALVFGVVMLVALVAVAIPGGWVIVAGPGILAWAAWPVWLTLVAIALLKRPEYRRD